jgi:hypothetical protein
MTRRLFVGNLSYEAADAAVQALFEACGEVAKVRIVTDGGSGRPRGYALVTMSTAGGAQLAVERLDGQSFDGRPLHVTADEEDDAPEEGGGQARGGFARTVRRLLGYVRYARDHEGAAAVSLFLFDDETGDLRGVLAEWDWTRTSFPSHVSEWPTVAASLSNRDIRLITADKASGAEQGWFEARGILGSVCVPLCEGGRRLGVLFFDFDGTTHSVDRADIPFLADVGDRCSRALGSATV